MFSIIIILSPCSSWDLKNMSEGTQGSISCDHRPHVERVEQHIIDTRPFLSLIIWLTRLQPKLVLLSGIWTNYQSCPALLPGVPGCSVCPLCTICQWHRDLGRWLKLPRVIVAGPGWLWPRVCAQCWGGQGPARQMSAACGSLVMAARAGLDRSRQPGPSSSGQWAVTRRPGPVWWPLQLHSDPRSRHSDQCTDTGPVTTLPPDAWQRR